MTRARHIAIGDAAYVVAGRRDPILGGLGDRVAAAIDAEIADRVARDKSWDALNQRIISAGERVDVSLARSRDHQAEAAAARAGDSWQREWARAGV